MRKIYFISTKLMGVRTNPYFVKSCPVVAVSDSLEKAREYCENRVKREERLWSHAPEYFERIECDDPNKFGYKFDYQSRLYMDIREKSVNDDEFAEWMENDRPYYAILRG